MIKSVYVDTVIAKQISEEGEAESQYSKISDSFSEDPNSTYNFSLNQNNVYLQSSFRREQVWTQLSLFFLSIVKPCITHTFSVYTAFATLIMTNIRLKIWY